MNCDKVAKHIYEWLRARADKAGVNGFVVGVSGGIDSAVVSTLCAMTNMPLTAVSMPIHQNKDHHDRSLEQLAFLENWANVKTEVVDLSDTFSALCAGLPVDMGDDLANANSRSRLRMVALYAFANSQGRLVVGTGNRVEDYGVGFFTKYGDGGVDLSPIGDLTKTDVRELAAYLGVPQSIRDAKPSDGLWNDARTDEDQIGATYPELEWAMDYYEINGLEFETLNQREKEVLSIYVDRHVKNSHKMEMPPVCVILPDVRE